MTKTIALDPEVAEQAPLLPIPTTGPETLEGLRKMILELPFEPSGAVKSENVVVSETPPVSVRIHRANASEGLRPALFSIHGGGYVMGSHTMEDAKFDRWCPKFDLVGVSVEYRLAPETPFPGPLEDCYAALRWTFENAERIGVDAGRIGIGGTSAGGGLCAALAQLVRERGEFEVRFQLLECPMLDDRQATPSSQAEDLVVWSRASNTFGWRSYLGDLHGTEDVPALAAPARATDLSGLPEAYVCVGGADGFRDENIEYARRLGAAGVPTELHVYPGAPHGVNLFAGTDVARRYNRDMEDWLGRQLERLGSA